MAKINANNERIKHKYFIFLKDAKQQSEETIDGVTKSLSRFEEYTNYKDFGNFRHEQASAFKTHLAKVGREDDAKPLSKATLKTTFAHLKSFFQWLSREQGYRSKINYSDADYFNLSLKDLRIAGAVRPKSFPTLEQIKYVINKMPSSTVVERRNRALIAFTILTGARDGAIASAKIRHVNIAKNCFFQDAREVKTKLSKTFPTYFLNVGEEVKDIFVQWVMYLKTEALYSESDPLFPQSKIGLNGQGVFANIGIQPKHWSTASPIREIFKQAFNNAGLEYFKPHSFRDTLVHLGQSRCQTAEQFKSWSQNFGHEGVLTTFNSYGEVSTQRQAEIISSLSINSDNLIRSENELANKIAKALIEHNLIK